jgi:hypothetical protein
MSITKCNVALLAKIQKSTLLSESNEISSAEDCLVVRCKQQIKSPRGSHDLGGFLCLETYYWGQLEDSFTDTLRTVYGHN